MVIWRWIKQIWTFKCVFRVYVLVLVHLCTFIWGLETWAESTFIRRLRPMTILFPTSNSKLNPCTHIVTEVSILYKVGGGRDARYIFQRKCCFQSKRHPKITGLDLQHCPKNKLFDKQKDRIQQFLSEDCTWICETVEVNRSSSSLGNVGKVTREVRQKMCISCCVIG